MSEQSSGVDRPVGMMPVRHAKYEGGPRGGFFEIPYLLALLPIFYLQLLHARLKLRYSLLKLGYTRFRCGLRCSCVRFRCGLHCRYLLFRVSRLSHRYVALGGDQTHLRAQQISHLGVGNSTENRVDEAGQHDGETEHPAGVQQSEI